MSENKNLELFKSLAGSNVNEHTKRKENLTYLSWAKAWDIFKRTCPDATYKVHKNEQNLPYFADETGIMVYTSVTVNGLEYEMWLPVMNAKNKAMKLAAYSIEGRKKNQRTGQYETYTEVIPAATMMDINKAVMRCLTKNLAMFGCGLHVYEGEDITIDEKDDMIAREISSQIDKLVGYVNNCADAQSLASLWQANPDFQEREAFKDAMWAKVKALIGKAQTRADLTDIYNNSQWAHSNPDLVDMCAVRQAEIKKGEKQ